MAQPRWHFRVLAMSPLQTHSCRMVGPVSAGSVAMWPCGRVAACACGCVAVRACGRVAACGMWPCGHVAMWLCGCMYMWLCVRVAMCMWPCACGRVPPRLQVAEEAAQ